MSTPKQQPPQQPAKPSGPPAPKPYSPSVFITEQKSLDGGQRPNAPRS
jgi:hypothetical protein